MKGGVTYFISLFFLHSVSGLTWLEHFKARNRVNIFIESQRTTVPEPHLKIIPGLVRLVFHDCSGKNCDGCINRNHLFNTRVVPVVEALETIFNYEDRHGFSIKKVMSRADFWALGSIEATKISIRLNNERCEASELEGCETKEMYLPFMYGRTDCSTSPYYTTQPLPELPSFFMNNKDTLAFFQKNFGFDAKETTVIMGGHSVGFSANTTSLPGTWEVGNVDGFSNQYFKNIINQNRHWSQAKTLRSNGEERWRWVGKCGAFGLATDINLVRDITVNTTTGRSSPYNSSPKSPTFIYVKKLLHQDYFARNYAKTFIKMLSLGKNKLKMPSCQ